MAFTGQIKFLEKPKNLLKDGASAVASSNTALAKFMLSMNRYVAWTSTGSDDTTTETITITLPSSVAVSRIFLINHNLKEFTVKYGGTPSEFTNVEGIGGALGGGIAETAYADDTAYYEFDEVTTDTIVITATKTQTVDAEKTIATVIVTSDIGTLVGYPDAGKGIEIDRNEQRSESITGLAHISKLGQTARISLNMSSYPEQSDVSLFETLFDRYDPFLVWPCGGNSDQFRISQRGWRLQDVFLMQTYGKMSSGFRSNVYVLGAEKNIKFEEVL